MLGLEEKTLIEITRLNSFYHFHFATGYVFPGERHPFWELVYVLSGQVDVGADERVYALNAGDLIFHQPDEYHSIWANYAHAPDMIVISFECTSEAMQHFEKRCIHGGGRLQSRFQALLEEGCRAFGDTLSQTEKTESSGHLGGAYSARLLLELLLMELLTELTSICPPALPPMQAVSPSLPDPREEETMSQIVLFMKENLNGELRLETLCRHMGMSKTALMNLFQKNFSSSPMAYFERLRMMEAQKLMRQSQLSIAAIADRLGFSSPAYFAARFRHIMGQTPRAYRQEWRNR